VDSGDAVSGAAAFAELSAELSIPSLSRCVCVLQQIDGKTLRLLTADLIMKHLGLALRLALKVVDCTNELVALRP
jgi:hypothetical protein